MSEQIADVIDDVADVIEKHGWIQGTYGSESAGYCIEGAIMVVGETLDQGYAARTPIYAAEAAIASHLRERFFIESGLRVIPTWNDMSGRTQQEVLDTLRLTAKEARAEGDG